MDNKINNLTQGLESGRARQRAVDSAKAKENRGEAEVEVKKQPRADDSVHVSGSTRALHEAEVRLGSHSDVSVERVEAIAKKISEGTYNVDAGRLAAKMMDFEASLSE